MLHHHIHFGLLYIVQVYVRTSWHRGVRFGFREGIYAVLDYLHLSLIAIPNALVRLQYVRDLEPLVFELATNLDSLAPVPSFVGLSSPWISRLYFMCSLIVVFGAYLVSPSRCDRYIYFVRV